MSSFSLSQALSNQRRISDALENSVSVKRNRVEEGPAGIPVQDQLLSSLAEAADWIVRTNNVEKNLELEMRLGMVSQPSRRWLSRGKQKRAHSIGDQQRKDHLLNFKAGVDEYHANQVKENLIHAGFVATTLPVQTLHCSPGYRYEILPSENKYSHGRPRVLIEAKDRLYTQDVALLAHDYDIRFGLAQERKIETPPSGFDPDAWDMQRVKKRTEYKHAQSARHSQLASTMKQSLPACPWRVDYTELQVRRRGNDTGGSSNGGGTIDSKEFEVEVELDAKVGRQWLELAIARGGALAPSTVPVEQDQFIGTTMWLRDELMAILELIAPCHLEEGLDQFETVLQRQELDVARRRYFRPVHMLNRIIQGENAATARAALLTEAPNKPQFLGSMPINLYRRSFVNYVLDPVVAQCPPRDTTTTSSTATPPEHPLDTYFIAEKSDGVRYLLYTMTVPPTDGQGGGSDQVIAVLMDRSCTFFTFAGSELLGRALGPGHVLDGEVVFHRDLKRSIFLIFDVLCWQERAMVGQVFAERFRRIQQEIIPLYTQNIRAQQPYTALPKEYYQRGLPEAERYLLLQGKHFYRLSEISTLIQRAHGGGSHIAYGGERIYKDTTPTDLLPGSGRLYPRAHHPTDGIIFQPNGAYVFGKHYELLKWKWADLRSIDLLIDPHGEERRDNSVTNENLYLLCAGPDNSLINCTKRGDVNVGLGPFDALRLMAEQDQVRRIRQSEGGTGANGSGGLIAEVAYDLRFGQWRYLKMRVDKQDPNYIDSVLGVFTEQAEAISEAELEYTLLCATQGYVADYDKHMAKMMEQLLAWQRGGRR